MFKSKLANVLGSALISMVFVLGRVANPDDPLLFLEDDREQRPFFILFNSIGFSSSGGGVSGLGSWSLLFGLSSNPSKEGRGSLKNEKLLVGGADRGTLFLCLP